MAWKTDSAQRTLPKLPWISSWFTFSPLYTRSNHRIIKIESYAKIRPSLFWLSARVASLALKVVRVRWSALFHAIQPNRGVISRVPSKDSTIDGQNVQSELTVEDPLDHIIQTAASPSFHACVSKSSGCPGHLMLKYFLELAFQECF